MQETMVLDRIRTSAGNYCRHIGDATILLIYELGSRPKYPACDGLGYVHPRRKALRLAHTARAMGL